MEGWEKKPQIKALIDKGKVSGKLVTHDIDNVILEIEGFDVDDIEKLYELIESNSIEIIDDIGDENLKEAIRNAYNDKFFVKEEKNFLELYN